MVLPLLLGPIFTLVGIADFGVWLGSGKDILEHLTGVDVVGTVLGLFGIREGPDYTGVVSSLEDVYILIIVAIAAIVVVGVAALLKEPKGKTKRRSLR